MTDGEDVGAREQREALATSERKTRKAIARTNQVLERLTVEYVGINDLKPNDYNPNRQSDHDFELLLRSMEEDGFTQPIVALSDGTIVDGEHRWRAAAKLGFEEVPVVKTEMTPEQMRVSTLRHNRARGSEDLTMTAEVLRDLEKLGSIEWAKDSLMLDDQELERLLADIPAPEALAADSFGNAWTPDAGGDPERDTELSTQVQSSPDGKWDKAASPAAVQATRDREAALAAAHTEEEREMVRKDSQEGFHRVSLIFHGEEAGLVKEVLGGAPAETIIAFCEKERGLTAPLKEQGWVTIDSVIGQRVIPVQAASVLRQAVESMVADGTVGTRNRFQVLEYLAADYLAGSNPVRGD